MCTDFVQLIIVCRLYSQLFINFLFFTHFLTSCISYTKLYIIYTVLCTYVIIVTLYLRANINITLIHVYSYYGVQLRNHVQFCEIHLFSSNNHRNCDVVCYASKCSGIASTANMDRK